MQPVELIASLVDDRVVVFGSLPPHGRDLDLLVRSCEAESLNAGLAQHGFENRGRIWARFTECRVDAVELAPAAGLRLAESELGALFAEASPIEPSGKVCRPASHHALLVLARRAMREGPTLRERRRERIRAELDRDPGAFERARERAPRWGASAALAALEAAYRDDETLSTSRRRRAIAEELGRWRGPLSARVGAWRAVLRRPRRGAVIALSGLDGCGKSSQAEHLTAALDRLGVDATMAWTSVAFHPPWLGRSARLAKSALGAGARRLGAGMEPDARPGAPRDSGDPAKALRSRSTALTFGWSTLVTLLLATQVARRIWPPLLRGEVVVCDRYLLDAWAHLLYQYGERRRFAVQLAILGAIFPPPRLAYLLEVAPETAAARKPEYDAEQNARRAAIYRDRAQALEVRVLDGDRPMDELCAELAREAWAAVR